MTDYAGESYTITHYGTFGELVLDPDNTTEVVIEIRAADKTTVIEAEVAMVWDPDETNEDGSTGRWEYSWDTAGYEAGTYWAKCTARGVGDGEVFEFKRQRLKTAVW